MQFGCSASALAVIGFGEIRQLEINGECLGELVGIFDGEIGNDGARLRHQIIASPLRLGWSGSRCWMRSRRRCSTTSSRFRRIALPERVRAGFRANGHRGGAGSSLAESEVSAVSSERRARLVVSCP